MAQFAGQKRTVAVVVDTNLWRSYLNLEQLRWLCEHLAAAGVQTWLPRYVLLEWSVHHYEAIRDHLRPELNRLIKAGLFSGPNPVPEWDVKHVAREIESRVSALPQLTILQPTGPAAIAGLEDQILGTGPGTVSGGSRTGGVDSAWVRDAVEHVGGIANIEQLIFLTNNRKDVQNTVAELGGQADQVRYSTDAKVWDELLRPISLSARRVRALKQAAAAHLDSWAASGVTVSPIKVDDEIREGYPADLEISAATLVGVPRAPFMISDLDFRAGDNQGRTGYARFTVTLQTSAEPIGMRIESGHAERFTNGIRSAVLLARGTATVKNDLVTGFDLEPLLLKSSSGSWENDDPDWCLSEIVEALTTLAGVTATIADDLTGDPADVAEQLKTGSTLILRSGRQEATVEYSAAYLAPGAVDEGEQWELTLTLPDSSQRTLTCYDDPDWYYGDRCFVPDATRVLSDTWSSLLSGS